MMEPSNSHRDSLPKELSQNVRTLGYASLLNDIASEAIYPLLPKFILSLGGGHAVLGLIEGLADSIASLLKLWSGAWSDRLGNRRGFINLGYALTVLSRPCLAIVGSVGAVALLRVVDRIGKGLRTAPRDALIADSTPKHLQGRAYGFHRAMDHLGATIGPLLAILFLWWFPEGIRWLMLGTIVPGILVLAMTFGRLQEMPQPEAVQQEQHSRTIRNAKFRLFLASMLVFTFANSSDVFLLVRAEEAGIASYLLPALWAMLHILKSIGTHQAGRLADKFSPKRLVVAGWLIYILIYLGFGYSSQAWHIWVLFAAYAGFYALTEPAEKKLVSMFAKQGESGTAFGWFHTVLGLANLPSSLLFGAIYQHYGPTVAFLWGAFMACLAPVLLSVVATPKIERRTNS